MPQDAVAAWYLYSYRLEKKEEKRKILPRKLHAQVPPLVEEGGDIGTFSGLGYCVAVPSPPPPQWQGLLLPGFKVGQ